MEQPSRKQPGYETDFAAWAAGQADLLRGRLLKQADFDNIAEELEGLSRAERRKLRSCLTLIITHMLKLVHQPDKASRSWLVTVQRERKNLERLLQDSPSLKSHLAELYREAYEDGRERASYETGLELTVFPGDAVFTLEQIREREFLPHGGLVDSLALRADTPTDHD